MAFIAVPAIVIPPLSRMVIRSLAPWASAPMPAKGVGYLSGKYPGGVTTVDGTPVAATVRVLYRPASGSLGDGALMAEVQSAPDGTWRVDGLDPSLKYDVVGRKAGFNDVIMANVSPKVGE